jgi:phosphatidylglycerophosphatase A
VPTILDRLAVFIGSGFFSGYSPFASGTFGSMVGVGLYLLLRPRDGRWAFYLGMLLLVTVIGIWSAGRCSAIFREEDPKRVVIDEVAGMLLSLAVLDGLSWKGVAAGFIIFRIFDVLKPPPAGWVDRHLHSGTGIMLDDLLAGVYTWIVMRLGLSLLGRGGP